MTPGHHSMAVRMGPESEGIVRMPDSDRMKAPGILGMQVVLDLYECDSEHLDDLEWVRHTLLQAAREAGATIVENVFHHFAPWGISGVVVIAESHLAIHIWPENRYAAIDVFTCGDSVQIEKACTYLAEAFRSQRPVRLRFTRGEQLMDESGRLRIVPRPGVSAT